MKPYLGAHSSIRVGVETILETDSADGKRGVVFEDDGETAYFYARDFTQTELTIVDALHIYNVDGVTDSEKPSEIKIIWSRDFMAAALLINQVPHAVFNFEEQCGYANNPFPEADPKSGWSHSKFNSDLIKLFYPER